MSAVNKTDLPQEATIITKQLLEEQLSNAEHKNIKVTHFDVSLATKPGENFLSVVFRVKVSFTSNEDEKSVVHLIVKVQHFNEEVSRAFMESKTFYKDITTYEQIIPEMYRLLDQKGHIFQRESLVPKFYGGFVKDQRCVISMEDLCVAGYKLADATNGLDLTHCQMVMREIAKFHALGYAIKERSSEKLKRWMTFLTHESLFSEAYKDCYGEYYNACMRSVIEVAKDTEKDPSIINRFDNLGKMDVFETIRNLYDTTNEFAVTCHGDCWESNIMFRYDKDGQPVDLKFIDFQLIRYAQPTTDLSFLFYLATTPQFRQKHLHDLLKLYHSSLMEALKHLDVTVPGYTYDVCKEQFYKYNLIGVMDALVFLPMTKAKEEDMPDYHNPDSAQVQEQLVKAVRNSGKVDWLVGTLYDGLEQGLY